MMTHTLMSFPLFEYHLATENYDVFSLEILKMSYYQLQYWVNMYTHTGIEHAWRILMSKKKM